MAGADTDASTASKLPAAAFYATHERLLTDELVEAVSISTPVRLHLEHAKAALRARKHVLVEKPATFSQEQFNELVAEADGRIVVAFHDAFGWEGNHFMDWHRAEFERQHGPIRTLSCRFCDHYLE